MENRGLRLALFDFCETLADFQTADEFVHFTREYYRRPMMTWRFFVYRVIRKLGIVSLLERKLPRASVNKRFILWQLKGYDMELLDTSAKLYYENRVKPHLIPVTIGRFNALKAEGYLPILVSGGYDLYLKYFAVEFGIDCVFCTRISFKSGVCRGTFNGNDCLREEKVRLLSEAFPKECVMESVAYSDSKSDLPMLIWANNAIVVKRRGSYSWAHDYGFQEMEW